MSLQNSLAFLMELQVNNDRNWFKENEKKYRAARATYEGFINELIHELRKMDDSVDVENAKSCLFRIYRDVRFSKNKEPYKTNFGAFIAKGGRKSPYAGYYVHLQPDQSFLGGGIYMPAANYLKAIRTAIFKDPASFKKVLNEPGFDQLFGGVHGEKLKTAPRGFPKDWPDIELLRNKHYAVMHSIDNSFWTKGNPVEKAMAVFEKQLPFNRYLNEIVVKV